MVKVDRPGTASTQWWVGWRFQCPSCGSWLALEGNEQPVRGLLRAMRIGLGTEDVSRGEIHLVGSENARRRQVWSRCANPSCQQQVRAATLHPPVELAAYPKSVPPAVEPKP